MELQRTDFRFFHHLRVRWVEVDIQKIVLSALSNITADMGQHIAHLKVTAISPTPCMGRSAPFVLCSVQASA